MSKAKSNSNVQDADRLFLTVPIGSVIPDPERPNIRGKVLDTTDLQPSVREHGILQPILVRHVPGEKGLYFRISGERRQVAARAVGLKELPVIVGEDFDERDIRRIMLASDLHKKEPHIVLGPKGEVIAGKCKAIYEELSDEETATTRQDLADDLGVSADVIGAYYMLYSDIPQIQKKVASGQMAITVYSLIKHHGIEVKLYLADKKGKVSANYVRTVLRTWKDRQQADEPDDDTLDMETQLERQPTKTEKVSLKIKKTMTVTQLLTGAAANLKAIAVSDKRPTGTDWAVIEEIELALGQIEADEYRRIHHED